MSRIVYVNGDFLREDDATISIFDRGFLFADSVYEVTAVLDGRLVDNEAHLKRLRRSLSEIRLDFPMSDEEIWEVQQELVARNGVREGGVYLQVSRGPADRDFAFPKEPKPTLIMFTQIRDLVDNAAARKGISIVTMEDLRWRRRDIKTVQLLAPSLAKQAALEAGADDAWLVEQGFVTEGSSNNAWIVKGEKVVTRPLSRDILAGITRRVVFELLKREPLVLEERPFRVEEAKEADEAFITSASSFVTPVVRIDNVPVANGKVGRITKKIRDLYLAEARRSSNPK